MHDEPLEHATLDTLGSEGSSVLAVLLLAVFWPARHPGGWVTVGDFAAEGVLLGDRSDRESLKAAIRRGVRRVSAPPLGLSLACRRTTARDPVSGRARREWDRRLVPPIQGGLEAWFVATGCTLIAPAELRQFLPVRDLQNSATGASIRGVFEQSLRQAESCLHLAALALPAHCLEVQILGGLQLQLRAHRDAPIQKRPCEPSS